MLTYKKKWHFIFLAVLTIGILQACSFSKFEAETEIEVKDFTYINQSNEKISLDSLKGTPWLAMFTFTQCATVCPAMTFNMTEVQESLIENKVKDYKIVSFSVDPEFDTPQVLTDYINHYPVPDLEKWELLTGYQQEEMEAFAAESFQALVKDDPSSNQVIHGTAFFLVDQNGNTVKSYDGNVDVPVNNITNDLKALIKNGH